MKQILVIDNSPAVTGAFRVMFHVAEKLKQEYHFHFAIPPSKRLHELLAGKGHAVLMINYVELSRTIRSLAYLPMLLFNSWKLYRYVQRNNISVIHVNDLYNMTGLLVKMWMPGIRLIYHVRLLPDSYVNRLYPVWLKIISKKADQIAVVSEAVFKKVSSYVAPGRIQLIYDFIELDDYNPGMKKSNTEAVSFLYLANFTPGKGHEHAIEAFRQAVGSNSSGRMLLTFVGNDFGKTKNKAFKKRLMRQAGALVPEGVIQFTGPADKPEEVMQQYDVLLNFSESESFSLTCYEAGYCGLPVIVTDCGGPVEFVVHGVTGLVVPRGDVRQMVEAILRLAADEAFRKKMGGEAKSTLRARAAQYRVVDKYAQLYQ